MLRVYVEIEKEKIEKRTTVGYDYGDIYLQMDSTGELYAFLDSTVPLAEMPEELKGVVTDVTLRETITLIQKTQGLYKHKTATATVLSCHAHGRIEQTLDIKAKNLEDLKELYLLIMGDKIRPACSFKTPRWKCLLRSILR